MSLSANDPPRTSTAGPTRRMPPFKFFFFSQSGIPPELDHLFPDENDHTIPTFSNDEPAPKGKYYNGRLEQQMRFTLASIAAEARKAEEFWVSTGGVLTDTHGQTDKPRMNAIRKELKLKKLEAQILQHWDSYDQAWVNMPTKLREDTISLRFDDIPWPLKGVGEREFQIRDLTVKRVEEFLMESLTVRNVSCTKKERIRSSFLRWHPDKLGWLLQRVHPEDIEMVQMGIGIVMESLQRLNS